MEPNLNEPATREPLLFDEADLDATQNEPHPLTAASYTGARVLRDRPHSYRQCVQMLASGKHSQIEIARLLQMTSRTVSAIRRENQESITQARAKIAGRAYAAGGLAAECVEEDLLDPDIRKKISTKDKAIVSGIMIDQAQKLTGAPTAIIGKLEARPDHGELAGYRARIRAADGQTTGPTPGMENGRKSIASKGADPAGGLLLPDSEPGPVDPEAWPDDLEPDEMLDEIDRYSL